MRRPTAVRSLLFASVSTLALTLGIADVQAADIPPRAVLKAPPVAPPIGVLTIWVEGAAIWTGGSNITGFGIPGLDPNTLRSVTGVDSFRTFDGFSNSSFPTFVGQKPRVGWEAAFGADWRFAGTPWHVSFDVRGGLSKANDKNFFFHTSCSRCGPDNDGFANLTVSEKFRERESHFVADFMIGRDFGIGLPVPVQVKVGVRVADLTASQNAELDFAFAYNSNNGRNVFGFALGANLRQHTSFLGAGPRLAVEGTIPLAQQWGFDWTGGVAALFGDRRFDLNASGVVGAGGGGGGGGFAFATVFDVDLCNVPHFFNGPCHQNAVVFNADATAALAYWFTPRAKLSAGFRFDGYWAALRTIDGFDANTALLSLHNENRFYYGPFVRLTGAF
jgi:hypothetical protein